MALLQNLPQMAMPAAHEPAFIVSKIGEEVSPFEPAFIVSKLGAEVATSSASRSTSPGSTSPPSSPGQDDAAALPDPALVNALPDFEYPVPFCIGSPFVGAKTSYPHSFEELYEERRVHSCPIGPPPGLDFESGLPTDSQVRQPIVNPQGWMSAPPTLAHLNCSILSQTSFSRPQLPVLQLASALTEGEVGTPEVPTVGSKGHFLGDCKPCAFFYTKGCGNGTECTFCHLCPAGEKQRRKKEKLAMHRDMRRMRGW